MAADEDKIAAHVDSIERASDNSIPHDLSDVDEKIIENLEKIGEEIWITISWNLGGAIFVTVGGRLSDTFGRRWFFISGAAILIVGSIVSAPGQSISQMIAGGAIFGAGSGFFEMSFGAVQEIVPNEYRMVTIGLFGASSLIAQIMSLCACAMIKYTHNWRNAYHLMIGFQAFNLAYLCFFYHPPKFETKHAHDGKSRMQLIKG